ncbi:MAG TPA: hypothetical protein VGQ83_23105 [Polyangia bacterium]|jgi:hypothetical protein
MSGHVRLFISQENLDRWTIEEKVGLDGEVLTLRDAELQVQLTPAMAVVRVAGGDADPHGLCGRVKTAAEITALGGEQYMTSLLIGETAYDVQPGFIGAPTPADPQRVRAAITALG